MLEVMTDKPQGPVPRSRPRTSLSPGVVFKTRYPSACKECRRRKQRCSLTQPCTNCARRFPQPPCEYGVDLKPKRSVHMPLPEPGASESQNQGPYSHLDLDAVYDALLQVEDRSDVADSPVGSAPSASTAVGFTAPSVPPPNGGTNRYFLLQGQMPDVQQLGLRFRDKTGVLAGQDIIELLQYILKTRLKVTNSIVKDEWHIDGAHLLRASQHVSSPGMSISRFDDEIRYLPMAHTQMNKELVRTHLQLMSRFKASLDGSPRPNNRFMKHWIPVSIQDPLVLHVVLCATASFLNETGRVPKTMLLVHRQTVMRMLNEHLATPHLCTDDSAMLAVAQSILTSWYWGSTEELHAHMAGFKRMIQMRGSIQNLGMEGFTSKVALIDDFVIALAHETEPLMFGEPGFEFHDPARVPLLQVNFNSPLLFDCPPFLSLAAAPLQLHPHTAQILDDLRALIKAVAELPDDPSADYPASLYQAAVAVLSSISLAPDDVMVPLSSRPPNLALAVDADNGTNGLKRKREGDDASGPRKAGTSEAEGRIPAPTDAPDLVHRCIRRTALIYSQAIVRRLPTSMICSEADFADIWSCAWTAGLDRWSSLSGIFTWLMIAIVASSHHSVHGRMAKTLLVTAFMYIGTENWHVAAAMAAAALKLQRWLRGGVSHPGDGVLSGAFGGETIVERYGFAFKDALPEVTVASVEEEDEDEGAD
ncbi:fungal specific transcription factor domain-containing protein [Ophiocordyceps camponoti-floridani]|uniref:Fungal specific transcription factor domain-containing protein n=1 Tax=Ophiocordyceps camponoti-floridani TaxID=2030778 RepID=A0A8H4VFD0_9HYPO|nr:fungal specific transcription factor domain-containing protein [Ophiocordyceps camponoti-floridani]